MNSPLHVTVLGTGAMGMLFGAYLSRSCLVTLAGRNERVASAIRSEGIRVEEKDGTARVFRVPAVTSPEGLPFADLILVFVKSRATIAALERFRPLIGPDTYLLTLQNGAGHEEELLRFTDASHVLIGSTFQGSTVTGDSSVRHGANEDTCFGTLCGKTDRIRPVRDAFNEAGLPCRISPDIRIQIWNKLFINTSNGPVNAILQMPKGYNAANPHARKLLTGLVREAVAVANADLKSCVFDEKEVLEGIFRVIEASPRGVTSIHDDLRYGRMTEVDVISGSVIRAAGRLGIPVPLHETVVTLIHALEERPLYRTAKE